MQVIVVKDGVVSLETVLDVHRWTVICFAARLANVWLEKDLLMSETKAPSTDNFRVRTGCHPG